MDDRERAKRNRPSLLLLIGVMVPTFLLLTKVFNLGVNWSFLIGLLVAVGIILPSSAPGMRRPTSGLDGGSGETSETASPDAPGPYLAEDPSSSTRRSRLLNTQPSGSRSSRDSIAKVKG